MSAPHGTRAYVVRLLFASLLLLGTACAQQPSDGDAKNAQSSALAARLDGLARDMNDVRQQIATSQQRIEALNAEVQEVRRQLAASTGNSSSEDLARAVQQLREQSDIQQAEIKEHNQTKVESVSKYPVKLSGLILFSSMLNDGLVDDIDDPVLALPRTPHTNHGSLAATMRQSIFGVEATGPRFGSARTSADLHVDFFNNVSYAGYGTSAGLLRLRTAHVNVDWPHNSVIAAYDTPLISPLQPTSLVSQGIPPLAWSGNLWTWSPQIEFLHSRETGRGTLSGELGLIDPASPGLASSPNRQPGAGERSRQPGYEARLSYAFGEDHAFRFGAGGYYGRQKYAYGNAVDAWAGTLDWKAPLSHLFEFSGEFYRGRAIAGLGGGAFKDYVYNSSGGRIQGLDAIGGWAQLKVRFSRELEANAAAGLDNAFANPLRYATLSPDQGPYYDLARNRTLLGNLIFRPRPYLMFSAEYRNFYTWRLDGAPDKAHGLALGAGYVF